MENKSDFSMHNKIKGFDLFSCEAQYHIDHSINNTFAHQYLGFRSQQSDIRYSYKSISGGSRKFARRVQKFRFFSAIVIIFSREVIGSVSIF